MIYCVEDDNAIRDLMLYTLGASGFHAQGFSDSTGFWQAMSEEKPELILLDIMLPGEDGITILKKLRAAAATANIPIIMATAKGSEFDKVIGLDTGADDYLVKPFGMMEMIARIKAVMRRTAPKTSQVLTCGEIALDETRHIVTVSGKQVVLTLKEYELLKLLMENAGQVFTRDILLSRIWGQDYLGETRTVDVHIGTLRTKLAKGGERIETVRGVGYKMVE
ncbi:MAG TPA: DNA-binding response regulator [Clostridiales bacterium]|nr:DNA-binding response regulator [Clostridiales bacterium]